MMELYCVGCKSKVLPAGPLVRESKVTRRGVKFFVKTTCSKGHRVTNIVKKTD